MRKKKNGKLGGGIKRKGGWGKEGETLLHPEK